MEGDNVTGDLESIRREMKRALSNAEIVVELNGPVIIRMRDNGVAVGDFMLTAYRNHREQN